MKDAGKMYEPVIYEGAGHGFMRAGEQPDALPGNKKAHDDAWKRLLDLLGKTTDTSSSAAACCDPNAAVSAGKLKESHRLERFAFILVASPSGEAAKVGCGRTIRRVERVGCHRKFGDQISLEGSESAFRGAQDTSWCAE